MPIPCTKMVGGKDIFADVQVAWQLANFPEGDLRPEDGHAAKASPRAVDHSPLEIDTRIRAESATHPDKSSRWSAHAFLNFARETPRLLFLWEIMRRPGIVSGTCRSPV